MLFFDKRKRRECILWFECEMFPIAHSFEPWSLGGGTVWKAGGLFHGGAFLEEESTSIMS